MATSQTNPTPDATEHKALEVRKTVFDLDTKGEVTLVKQGDFEPVETMEQFVSRLGNDAGLILRLANKALESYTEEQLASDTTKPWLVVDEDENGIETLAPYSGTPISEEKGKQLGATVINIAKLMFSYAKQMVPGNVEENRKAKAAAKAQALQMVLSNPAAVEALRK